MRRIGCIDVVPDEGRLVLSHDDAWLARLCEARQQLDHPHREGNVIARQGAEQAHQDGEQVPVDEKKEFNNRLRMRIEMKIRMAYMRSSPLPTP